MKNLPDHLISNWDKALEFKIQQKKEEWLQFLTILDEHKVKNVLEIGSYDGGSTMSFSLICDTLYTIEFIDPRYDVNKMKDNCSFTYIQGNSGLPEIVELVHKMTDTKFDLLFIDGNHVGEFAGDDFLNYYDMVRPGGLVALHDIIDSTYHQKFNILIYKVWEELKKKYKHIEIKEPPFEWGGIGVIWLP